MFTLKNQKILLKIEGLEIRYRRTMTKKRTSSLPSTFKLIITYEYVYIIVYKTYKCNLYK